MTNEETIKRLKCFHACSMAQRPNGCNVLVDTVWCQPDSCPFYLTREEWDASIVKAGRTASRMGMFDEWLDRQPKGWYSNAVKNALRKAGFRV